MHCSHAVFSGCGVMQQTRRHYIVAIDGWNQASPARASDTDTIQDVTLFSSSFNATINRLSCT